jgi:hypothetical protein
MDLIYFFAALAFFGLTAALAVAFDKLRRR